MTRVSCVSDLHLFCRRSRAEVFRDAIEDAIRDSDVFVLNGDTFDFRWSTHKSVPDTVNASIDWLQDITSKHPECDFRFVLGNHDTVAPFLDAMERFVPTIPNLEWEPYHWRIGDHVFLHGDVVGGNMTAADLEAYRRVWMTEEPRSAFWNRVWDAAFGVGIHKLVNRLWFPTDRIVERVQYHLDDIGLGPGSGIRHVVFGHTHVRVHALERNGQLFYNCGAPMPNIPFDVLRFDVEHAIT